MVFITLPSALAEVSASDPPRWRPPVVSAIRWVGR
jgi:hypothetical protein